MVEQNKPVRSRDEQIGAIANDWIAEGMGPDIAHERSAQMILEAEARGAAEQRRKDAEGQEPVAYTSQIDLDRVRKGKTGDIYSTQKWEGSDDAVFTIPLYTHPANVAALEGRIAELEKERDALRRQIQAMNPGSVRPVIHSPIRFMDDPRPIRKREGGVS